MDKVLQLLMENGHISGEEISRRLGITRAAVWKQVERLREAGFVVEAAGKKGYRLASSPDSILPAYLQRGLSTQWAGQPPFLYHEEMTSTNTILKEAALQGASRGTVAICERQTMGKGRLGRGWDSVAGEGIYMSLLLRPNLHPSKAQLLTLAAAISMSMGVEEATGVSVAIKWPNDLVLKGKKVCGILLEMGADTDAIEYVVVGTGLNTGAGAYPKTLAEKAISLEEALGHKPHRADIIRAYLKAMEAMTAAVETRGMEGILPAYIERSCTLGQPVQVQGAQCFTGVAEAIDEEGALLIRDGDGTLRRVLAGDVSVRGVMGYV